MAGSLAAVTGREVTPRKTVANDGREQHLAILLMALAPSLKTMRENYYV